jgi:hypothetical protein
MVDVGVGPWRLTKGMAVQTNQPVSKIKTLPIVKTTFILYSPFRIKLQHVYYQP